MQEFLFLKPQFLKKGFCKQSRLNRHLLAKGFYFTLLNLSQKISLSTIMIPSELANNTTIFFKLIHRTGMSNSCSTVCTTVLSLLNVLKILRDLFGIKNIVNSCINSMDSKYRSGN